MRKSEEWNEGRFLNSEVGMRESEEWNEGRLLNAEKGPGCRALGTRHKE